MGIGSEGGKNKLSKPVGSRRIYVCHTYYHVYVTCLKELALRAEAEGTHGAEAEAVHETDADPKRTSGTAVQTCGCASLVLSKMSNDFRDLKTRAMVSGLFSEVIEFDEKDYTFFPELVGLKKDRGNLAANLLQRIRFCRRYAELEAPYVPVDFTKYDDIYVFCDSDPIGYYLSRQRIRYHAVEDGLDCIRYRDTARDDNRGHFALKAKLAAMGLIFIQNGYGKYCIDMEVNDLSALDHPTEKMIEVPREALVERLTGKDRELLTELFIANREQLAAALQAADAAKRPKVLILTEPLCKDLKMRVKLFRDMIEEYGKLPSENSDGGPDRATAAAGDGRSAVIVIKPHPRDVVDYTEVFPEHIVLDKFFPMEILNFLEPAAGTESQGAEERTPQLFDRVVTVFTVPSSIHCAREKIYLGASYMDRYEDPQEHRSVTNSVKTVTAG